MRSYKYAYVGVLHVYVCMCVGVLVFLYHYLQMASYLVLRAYESGIDSVFVDLLCKFKSICKWDGCDPLDIVTPCIRLWIVRKVHPWKPHKDDFLDR